MKVNVKRLYAVLLVIAIVAVVGLTLWRTYWWGYYASPYPKVSWGTYVELQSDYNYTHGVTIPALQSTIYKLRMEIDDLQATLNSTGIR